MAKNYYSDDDGAPAAKPQTQGDDSPESGSETALLPKSLFHGKDLKPGDKCDITVVRVLEDQIEVEGCEDSEEEEPQQPEQASMPEDGGGGGDGGGSGNPMME
jgi:hypothetical protein